MPFGLLVMIMMDNFAGALGCYSCCSSPQHPVILQGGCVAEMAILVEGLDTFYLQVSSSEALPCPLLHTSAVPSFTPSFNPIRTPHSPTELHGHHASASSQGLTHKFYCLQHARHYYPSWAYCLPTTLMRIPVSFALATVLVGIFYYVIGFDANPGR